jgi:hypothetical protein
MKAEWTNIWKEAAYIELRPLGFWVRGFESRPGHGCLYFVFKFCCPV